MAVDKSKAEKDILDWIRKGSSILKAYVTIGNIRDKQGCKRLLKRKRLKTMKKISVDPGYRGEEFQEIAKENRKEFEVSISA